MKTKSFWWLVLLLASVTAFAQDPAPPAAPGSGPGSMGSMHRPMGMWWKNSDVASKLKLSDQQVQQLENTFYQHRLKLVDLRANVEKQDLQLQQLLDAANPDDSAILTQVDQLSAARNQLAREFTLMSLDFRKVLTPDQWKQLRSMMPGPGQHFMRRQFGHGRSNGGPGAPGGPDGPPPPPGSLP